MWPSPIFKGLPYHPFMAPPIGLTYPSYPFTPWHQLNPMDNQQPMFWPQLQLSNSSNVPQQNEQKFHMTPSREVGSSSQNNLLFQPYNIGFGAPPLMFPLSSNIHRTPVALPDHDVREQTAQHKPSRPSLGVLEAEVAKVNQAMLSREIDETDSRLINYSKLSPLSDISPENRLTSLCHKEDHFESNRKYSSSRRVHSPPVVGSCFAIPSPNASSTPLKPLEQKQNPESKPDEKNKDTTQECTAKLTAVVKAEQDSEIQQPLDLRVKKRSAEDIEAGPHRDTKRSKLESYTHILTPGRDSTMAQRSVNPSNGSSMYLSSGYDSGLVADSAHDSTNSYEENVCLIKSGSYVMYCCQHCEYTTLDKLEAKDHMGEHCDHVIKQRCTICEKDYSFSGDIIRHVLQSHQPYDTRAFKCSQLNCNGAYSQEKLLNFHLRYVHGEKSYKCLETGCGKSYSSGSALKHHQFVHTDIFKCSWVGCGKRFRDDYNLRTHYMIHTGKKPRQCTQCDYSCVQKNSMDWHMKTKHKC